MRKYFLAIFGAIIFTGCNDDDSSINSTNDLPISYYELTGYNNQLEHTLISVTADKAIDFDKDGNSSTDVYAQMTKCELDDLFVFTYVKSKNTYVWSMLENNIFCENSSFIKNTGAFNPDPSQRTIEFYDDEDELVFKVTNVKLVERNTPEKVSFELTFDFFDPHFQTTLHYKYLKEY